jgi:hypothetical protein
MTLAFSLSRMTDNIITDKASSECRSLATAFYERFPCEIGDMMYSYLVAPSVDRGPSIQIGDLQPPPDALEFGYVDWEHYGESKDLQPTDFVFDPKYVGNEMAREILEQYYSQNSFYVCELIELHELLT